MTTTGENRENYSVKIEPRPLRFADPAAYSAWAARADAWAIRDKKFSDYLAQEIAYAEVAA